MRNNFILELENLIQSKKLYKIQEIESKKREYKNILEFLKEPRYISFSKNYGLIFIFILLLVVLFFSIILIFSPNIVQEYLNIHELSFNTFIFFSGIFIFLSFMLILFLFFNKIRKNNHIYKMNKLMNEVIELVDKYEIEEKARYEAIVDFFLDFNRKRF